MIHEHVETFLSVVSCGSISAAAKQLFISQAAVSLRIKQLEEELGAPLIYRSKGYRNIELTAFGKAFVPIAGQWESLWKDAQNLRNLSEIRTLTVAGVDAFICYKLTPFFKQMIKSKPYYKLDVRTHHSNEICELIENRTADIGFLFGQVTYPNIVTRMVYREDMYLVCHKDSSYGDDILCSELDPSLEVFLNWGPDCHRWHNAHWGSVRHPLISINSGSSISQYLDVPGWWSVAPLSVIRGMLHTDSLVCYRLKEPPAPRICYELTNRHLSPSRRETIDRFREEFDAYIAASENIAADQRVGS